MTVSSRVADCYSVLGVPPDATSADIARAFRRLAKDLHPDAEGGDARRFAEVSEAWAVLRDPHRRALHDRLRESESVRVQTIRPAARRTPRRLSRRGATAMVSSGAALFVLGLLAAAFTVVSAVDSAQFKSSSTLVTATVLERDGDQQIRFETPDGETVVTDLPAKENSGVVGATIDVRYDPDDLADVRIDESTVGRDVTFGIIALKLLVGGPVLVFVGIRARRRLAERSGGASIATGATAVR